MMKQFSVLLKGQRTYFAKNAEHAMEIARKDIEVIPPQFKVGLLSISEKREEND